MKTAIAGIPLDLDPGQHEFDILLRSPGLVFGQKKNLVLTAGAPQYVEQPVLLVECDPDGPLRSRKFALVATNEVMTPKDGLIAKWCASGIAIASGRMGHLFELVEAQ